MAADTPDRRVNTDAKIENDGVKRQPHERDESPDGQDTRPRGIMKQAAEDIENGLVDTANYQGHGTPGVEQAVDVKPGASGQANPLPDRNRDMRDHDSTIPDGGKNR